MKKLRAAIRKVRKEEPIYHLDDLFKILDQNAQTIDQLTEDFLLGCTIVTIIAFSELRLEEVMRATAEKDIDNSWVMSTSIFKKPISKVTLTFRQTSTSFHFTCFLARQLDKEEQQQTKTDNAMVFDKDQSSCLHVVSIKSSTCNNELSRRQQISYNYLNQILLHYQSHKPGSNILSNQQIFKTQGRSQHSLTVL
ncbi:MAG: hypothetical protein EZS28_024817 [Streblomastix strix]|uniref:Tyr recombinase domain-containing protein n=1 Tax=Streblomastix strix TaxID=222440 RepID=A0A5J4VAX3_9EUKA|nr:MAG: hypothetical protein EZS28_024817 [Streblomastix strix]